MTPAELRRQQALLAQQAAAREAEAREARARAEAQRLATEQAARIAAEAAARESTRLELEARLRREQEERDAAKREQEARLEREAEARRAAALRVQQEQQSRERLYQTGIQAGAVVGGVLLGKRLAKGIEARHIAHLNARANQLTAVGTQAQGLMKPGKNGYITAAQRTQLGGVVRAQQHIGELDLCLQAQHRASDVSRRLESIPGIGLIGATAIAATITDPSAFKSGRDLAAWIGLVPRQHSTGGKDRLGSISKQGDRYLRRLLVVGAMAVVRQARRRPGEHPWIAKLLAKKPIKLVAIAVANKTARIAWAIMSRGGTYRAPALAVAA